MSSCVQEPVVYVEGEGSPLRLPQRVMGHSWVRVGRGPRERRP